MIIPVWSRNTTGSWTKTPLTQYTATYVPWDVPGFGVVATKPTRTLPDDIQRDMNRFVAVHARHVTSALPEIAYARLKGLLGRISPTSHILPFIALLIIGLAGLSRFAWIGVITSALSFSFYLTYATPAAYPLYYFETFPVVGLTLAAGIAAIVRFFLHRLPNTANLESRVVVAATLAVIAAGSTGAGRIRASRGGDNRFRTMIDGIRTDNNVVFVKYPTQSSEPLLLVWNPASLEKARSVVVFDRGPLNEQLLRFFPGRHPYLLDVPAGRLSEFASRRPSP
jgi:hypothetical protein